ncbi:MAG: riboflavin biosynthesis protein RibF [Bdellovibrionales bacterium GWC1_52_8]|nr:MAG: riboflavin biosynthesis protein RibF [Bdellovibrionales bacterium GWB1_52_6]OFZ02549.1 MAG: riboflavin biosynthesis protein RibF [Bdellovibrionales bacterium GWA1_52_35]OFZ39561.1 MAG: riboflavin biosynthesis protein RibF [Bdellovibrionales bacterium GWC1_52_8]HCM41398.1 bifunctional riboflavin kinase/FAD synthetase [Bdellovibrionales bacterium]
MQIIRGISQLSHNLPHPVVTIGNFDGVHIGHREIIELVKAKALARGGSSVVYTFRPHPQATLSTAGAVSLLTTYDEKLEILAELGVDLVVEEPFTREFSTIEPEQFFNDLILHRLSAEAIVVGYDFSFGKERKGHIPALQAFCNSAGVELTVVPPHRLEGEIVSSTHVRQHLLAAEVEMAEPLLSRPFFYRGVVVRGEGRGRQLGFPTANLKLENKLTLPLGVYASNAIFEGKAYPSVTNIGVRPTFYPDPEHQLPALVETHLLDVNLNLYGNTLEVRFKKYLRPEQRFASIDGLKKQIALDSEEARKLLT